RPRSPGTHSTRWNSGPSCTSVACPRPSLVFPTRRPTTPGMTPDGGMVPGSGRFGRGPLERQAKPASAPLYNADVLSSRGDPSSDVIRVAHLTKRFGSVTVVHDLSFAVAAGEIVGFLGPNGAGKTTTLAMLLGLLLPTAGEIRVLGLPMPAERQRILARVNFTSPYVSLPGNLTVDEHLAVFARMYRLRHAPH